MKENVKSICCKNEEQKMKLRTIAAVKKNNTIYFSPMYLNGVFSLDLDNDNEVRCINIFKEEKKLDFLYRRVYVYQDNVWFVPEQAEHVAKFNIATNEIQVYKFRYHKQSLNGMFQYSDSFVFNDKYLCLVPGNTDALVIVDMETGKEKIVYDVVDPEKESYISGTYADRYIWLCPFESRYLVRVDIEDGNVMRYKWKYGKQDFDGVCAVDNKLYFAPHKATVCLSINVQNMQESKLDISDIKSVNDKFQGIFKIDNELWCMPFTAKYFLRYNLQNKKVTKYIGNNHKLFENWEWNTNNFMPVDFGEKVMLASCFMNGFLTYEVEDDQFVNNELNFSTDRLEEYYEKCLQYGVLQEQFKHEIIIEREGFLKNYCKSIIKSYNCTEKVINKE